MPTLRVLEGPDKGKTFELEGDIIFVGRGAKNDIRIGDHTISRMHLKIFSIGTALFVEDLKSSNGTLINGARLEPGEGHQVDGEDLITLGDTVVRIEDVTVPKDPGLEGLPSKPPRKASEEPLHPELVERRSRTFRETEFLSKLSELLRGPIKLGEALEKISEQLLDMLPRVDRVAVFVRDKETGDVRQGAMKAKPDSLSVPFSLEAVTTAFDEGKAVTVADATGQRIANAVDDGGTMEIKSLLCVPMNAHGRVFGVLYLDGIQGPYAYRNEDLLWLETLGTVIAYAIENAELVSRLTTIATLASSKQK
jgi:putative methionine-R-sulfoxide reductase with GAF domain